MNIIRELLDSKKFVGALITMASAIAVKLGLPETDVSEILAIVSPMLVYVGAQGFADIGKERAIAQSAVERVQLEEGRPSFGMPEPSQVVIDAIKSNAETIKEVLQ